MTIKINCEMVGKELADHFINQLKSNQIDPNPTKIKCLVTKKTGEDVEVDFNKIKFIYSNE